MKHTKEEYFDLIMEFNVSDFRRLNPKDANNRGCNWGCFSVVSQHVKGKTKEECLDKIFEAVELKREKINWYNSLPTMEEFINSDKYIVDGREYVFKGGRDLTIHDMLTYITYSSDDVKEIKEIGIDNWRDRNHMRMLDYLLKIQPKTDDE